MYSYSFPPADFTCIGPADVDVYSTQVFSRAAAPFLTREVYHFRCDTCSPRIKTEYPRRSVITILLAPLSANATIVLKDG